MPTIFRQDGYRVWFPLLRDATSEQRRNWSMIGTGHGIHWPDLDEDVSVRAWMGCAT